VSVLDEDQVRRLSDAVSATPGAAFWDHLHRADGLGFGWLWCIGDANGLIAEGATWTRRGAMRALSVIRRERTEDAA